MPRKPILRFQIYYQAGAMLHAGPVLHAKTPAGAIAAFIKSIAQADAAEITVISAVAA